MCVRAAEIQNNKWHIWLIHNYKKHFHLVTHHVHLGDRQLLVCGVERRGALTGCVYVMSEIIPRVASTNSTSTCTAFQTMVSFIETYTTDSLSVIFAALNISWFIIPFHCYWNNEYTQLWIRASATVWRALVLSPCLQEALPFHNCSTISSCNSFCSLPQPPASPQIGGMDMAVSPIPCQLSLLYSNCRSLVPKLDNLRVQANSLNPCIIALTGTWLDVA